MPDLSPQQKLGRIKMLRSALNHHKMRAWSKAESALADAGMDVARYLAFNGKSRVAGRQLIEQWLDRASDSVPDR